jgi:hypothetical protein
MHRQEIWTIDSLVNATDGDDAEAGTRARGIPRSLLTIVASGYGNNSTLVSDPTGDS